MAVRPSDWAHLDAAHGPLAGVALQEEMEREGALRGGGGLVAPVQRAVDFLEGALGGCGVSNGTDSGSLSALRLFPRLPRPLRPRLPRACLR